MRRIIPLFLCLFISVAYGKRLHHESWYQKLWCEGKGKTEVVQADKTRVDCLTNTHAIEFDLVTSGQKRLASHWATV